MTTGAGECQQREFSDQSHFTLVKQIAALCCLKLGVLRQGIMGKRVALHGRNQDRLLGKQDRMKGLLPLLPWPGRGI